MTELSSTFGVSEAGIAVASTVSVLLTLASGSGREGGGDWTDKYAFENKIKITEKIL
jgi:hypothetical protein